MKTVWPLQSQALAFYGDPRTKGWLQANTVDVVSPWTLHMDGVVVSHILIHKKCATSLARVLKAVWDGVGLDYGKIQQLRYDRYSGSYALRKMRGGTAMSMHSFACALDLDSEDNQQHSQHHLFTDDSLIVKEFEKEGWVWGGRWGAGSIDAMHFQAARVHA
jgi:hypothetical protein